MMGQRREKEMQQKLLSAKKKKSKKKREYNCIYRTHNNTYILYVLERDLFI